MSSVYGCPYVNYRIKNLEDVPFAEIHFCFSRAFSDYAVQAVKMSEAALLRRARKNHFAPAASIGVWVDQTLVAISLTGIDRVNGERRAYDICTGVVPEYRGKGLAGKLVEEITTRLKQAAVDAFQLEVLQSNSAGLRAYVKAGFGVSRGLVIYAGTAASAGAAAGPFSISRIGVKELRRLSAELDFEPSYEQRDSALAQLEEELIVLGAFDNGECIAALAFDPQTAWLMRLVTRRQCRRWGAASALLNELGARLPFGTLIKAVNIDERDRATMAFMSAYGFQESIRQWEMRLEL